MSNILLVPVHLDALVLDHDQMVVETTADFSRLPYCDNGKYDVHPDIANISEELVATPFQNENLLLKAGIHLHWSLPDALTKAQYVKDSSGNGRQVFPLVPNRWLVMRCNDKDVVQKTWIVESDFLHPPQNAPLSASLEAPATVVAGVAVPYRPDNYKGQPYRYMGQSVEIAGYSEDPRAAYYPELTAVGYGEPTFAAFYPNCFSVFGFFDGEYSGKNDGRQYYLTGWYSDPTRDVLLTHFKNARELAETFKWKIVPEGVAEGPAFPTQMLCYARLILGPPKPKLRSQTVTLAVGNTGTEALSACMTRKLRGRKEVVEDHLEAMHLSATLAHRQLDVGPKFDEARHEKGFTAVSGGTLWTVRAESDANAAANVTNTPAPITLPPEIGNLLNIVNKRQSEYDRAWQQIESQRIQLFSDWYKYMLCAYPPEETRDVYPDVDEVASYIAERVKSLETKIAHAGKVEVTTDERGVVVATVISARAGSQSAAAELAKAINNLQASIGNSSTYKLKETSGPRYWQPTEPSILLEGDLAEASKRHGHDAPRNELLKTQLWTDPGAISPFGQNWREKVRRKIGEMADPKDFAFSTWEGQPWNPFLLEWVVEVSPIANKSNIDPRTGRFNENFITDNYQLAENDVDLSLKADRGETVSAANLYSGRSILTPHAGEQLVNQTEDHLEREVLPMFYQHANVLMSADGRAFLKKNMYGIEDWYRRRAGLQANEQLNSKWSQSTPQENRDPNLTAFDVLREMTNTNSLSQSLSGFNDALLMHKQTPQLHIADPLGFDDYQTFANLVGVTVSNSIYSAPAPQNDFNPIRTGVIKIHRLRLIDTFGQIKDLDVSKILISDPLQDGPAKTVVSLPPRLMQPARINFRWLSADSDEEEMNDHPATTPICGWLLANNLDNSLMVYDNNGRALGSVVKKDTGPAWASAPGGLGVSSVDEIKNLHLRKIVKTTLEWSRDNKYLDDFITAIDSAIENIEPENFAHHQDLALLMGRPLAIVRASVNLELKGLPATHQGWNEFRQDLQRDGRDDNGFTRVRFPIRIGEYKQFNDGTVGYWKEKDGKYEDEAFFAPQSDNAAFKGTTHLKTHKNPEAMIFFQTVESPPQILTLLIDPRGLVHATTGVVPAKAINIPPDQYSAALQAIEITFLSTPVLTDAGKIHLPLPDEAGYQWSWLHQDLKHTWSEVSTRGIVRKQTFIDEFGSAADTIWRDLGTPTLGWIDPIDETRASVIAKDKRAQSSLPASMNTDKIEDILDRAHIGPVDPTAKFSGQQEIREGWLKLSAAPVASRKNQKP